MCRQLARSSGRENRPVIQSKDMSSLASLLSEKFKVDAQVFGEVSQMFWRFDISGDGLLCEKEANVLMFASFRCRYWVPGALCGVSWFPVVCVRP